MKSPIQCLHCGHKNPVGANFCGKCGTQLWDLCPNCGTNNPPANNFCYQCGQPLGPSTAPESPFSPSQPYRPPDLQEDAPWQVGSPPIPGASEAERRQLTVMFCDLVGSTALSERLDPEELREVVRAYQQVCSEVVDRFEGHIAQYLGDGLLVYFGYPLAHEDDAQRAVRTGLGIVEEVRNLNKNLRQDSGVTLAVRVGIHTGLVVIGEMGGGDKHEQLALGDTPNIAARVQGIAEPDTVVISLATYRLIQGFFICQDLGLYALRGLSLPMEVYQVLKESGVQSRLEVAAKVGLTPLVGREQEMELLLERWRQAQEGLGQVILLSGEAGIGKSRLVRVLKERIVQERHRWLESRCSPYYQNSTLYPMIDLLQRMLGFRREDSPEEKLNKLERALGEHGLPLAKGVPLFASLLSVPLSDRYPPLNLSPQKQKQKTLEALLAWLMEGTEKRPALIIVEDLHWADPSTLELLGLLIDQAPTARILTVLTFRSEFYPLWPPRSYLIQIMLNRLAHSQVEVMVEKITGGKKLPVEVLRQIVVKTDGVPLFVEELTKMVLESGWLRTREDRYELTGPLPPLAIPVTLQDSLMARLDRLTTVKEVAQLGAVLGREFTYELLQAVSSLDERTLQRELERLVETELLYQRGLPPQARYIFKHALIQEAAYESLLKSKRQQYHHRVAQVLEEQFPEIVETRPELLAYHYMRAGLKEEAIAYWQKAGEKAIERSTHVEAIGHLTKGLELLKTLPESPWRIRQELALQTILGPALMNVKGYATPEVEEAYMRVRELYQQVGETEQLFPVLSGLWLFYNVRAELQTARELAEQLLSLAQGAQDPARLLQAHHASWPTLFCLGELVTARAHLEQGITLYNSQQYRSQAFLYIGHDPGVCCRNHAAHILWYLGYADQALREIRDALALAHELAHPFSLAQAQGFAAWLYQLCREGPITQEQAEATLTLCTKQGFPLWTAWGMILRGWALVEQGQPEEGIAQMRQGLAAWRATGSQLYLSYFLALLAEAYGKVGRAEEGLTVLTEALEIVNRHKERFYEAELYRLRGELLLRIGESGNRGDGEPRFLGSPSPPFSVSPSPHLPRGVFSSGYRSCPQTGYKISGAKGDHKFKPPVTTTRQPRRGAPKADQDLRRVHGGV